MSPDGITLHLIIRELRETLLAGRVERVFQPERQEIILVIRSS
jgi:predicted ribosome quality control (RQC) complex YloA/Tae2 family protein